MEKETSSSPQAVPAFLISSSFFFFFREEYDSCLVNENTNTAKTCVIY